MSFDEVKEWLKEGQEVWIELAPASRLGIAEAFSLSGDPTPQIFGMFKTLGFKGALDTPVGADVVALLEAKEFIEKEKHKSLPMFTSCCTGWRMFFFKKYPKLKPHISRTISPQMMSGALIKKFLANKDVKVVAVMPCLLKHMESSFTFEGVKYVDAVLTTNDFINWVKNENLEFGQTWRSAVEPSAAGMAFGATGGVLSAFITYLKKMVDVEIISNADPVVVKALGIELKFAKVFGLENVDAAVKKAMNHDLDVVEVMACPFGCVGGAGQPRIPFPKIKERAEQMRKIASGYPPTLFDVEGGKKLINSVLALGEKEREEVFKFKY